MNPAVADAATDDSFQDDTLTLSLPSARQPLLNLTHDASSDLTPLEQDVLDEYTRLLSNMNELAATLSDLASGPVTVQIAESLRLLERKVASVYTLMKASVYSIVLQQGEGVGMEEGGETVLMERD